MTGHPLAASLREFALRLPEAWEDHPWGENVAKVGKKVFVFFGLPDAERPFGMTVKLPASYDAAMSLPWARNPGYRMDRGHWVWLQPPDDTPFEMLADWIEESYRSVAPKACCGLLTRQPGRTRVPPRRRIDRCPRDTTRSRRSGPSPTSSATSRWRR